MIIKMYYENEIRTGTFDNSKVSFTYEISEVLGAFAKRERVDIKNKCIGETGPLLDILLPTTDPINTLKHVEIYEGAILIKDIFVMTEPIYRIYMAPTPEVELGLAEPHLIEAILFNL